VAEAQRGAVIDQQAEAITQSRNLRSIELFIKT
jgi:hypothetical protein